MDDTRNASQILIYQADDGATKLEVRLENETVWLSQKQLAELFQVGVNTINYHIKEIFESRELESEGTIRKFRIVQIEGSRQVNRPVDHYNLDMIISVGYRVKSHVATHFRQWATQRLREYLIKGFTMDDERLKRAGGGNYFEELLARIRDIRSSEKVFWWISTPPALIMIPAPRRHGNSLPRCRIRCTGPATVRRPPKLSSAVPMPENRTWE
jgi:hypothetical protein